ncbi:hypothetical protein DSO57_1029675 [Entomophthora muscae]|uniref:Uncharacterized protein n=1 Tax=Entomophthora muscae TaxID=34485 RepID=A0ACC2SQ92_9FUNG|nr:hypothetical protein DSO57_1029675 [Entomophthora muscae]
MLDQEACPKRYMPNKEEINKDLLNRVLTVNTVTRKQAICTESIPSKKAVDTISIPYAEQLCMPYAEVTHERQRQKVVSTIEVSTSLHKFGYLEIPEARPNNCAGVVSCSVQRIRRS